MIKRVLLVSLALATTVWAGDIWKEKPYQQWDEKDINKILADSPWAKQTAAEVTWRSGQQQAGTSDSNSNSIGGGMGPYGSTSASGRPSGAVQQASFFATWESSKTIREAVFRRRILKGTMKGSEAEELLGQEPSGYMIILRGPDMTLFAAADDTGLKQYAYLELKKSKQKIAATEVQVQRGPDGNTKFVSFSFPKKTPSGEATIPVSEKGADFVSRVGKTNFKFSFDLQKMVDNQGQDL
jgi:hypothetical protein